MFLNQTSPVKKPGTVVYACSGCSDAGELADRIARQLSRDGAAEMSCLAGIGGRVKPLVNRAASAEPSSDNQGIRYIRNGIHATLFRLPQVTFCGPN